MEVREGKTWESPLHHQSAFSGGGIGYLGQANLLSLVRLVSPVSLCSELVILFCLLGQSKGVESYFFRVPFGLGFKPFGFGSASIPEQHSVPVRTGSE